MTTLRVRHSVRELQNMYDQGNTKPLDDLIRAWIGIKSLPVDDLNSFFIIGGYHGEPFEGQGATLKQYWGGYCNHGNVLFPTWHRVYVLRIEEALQSFEPDVMMPYWDETSEETLRLGIPKVLTEEKYELDGVLVDNPLQSYIFQKDVMDVKGESLYSKPEGYKTVRYPLSGLVGTQAAQEKTEIHNNKFPNHTENTALLNENVRAWLISGSTSDKSSKPKTTGTAYKYFRCLDAPNYTAFSNVVSASEWTQNNSGHTIVALEDPHNDVHLAVGGFDVPEQGEFGLIAGANGDMGENNTAGLDPIFFFHHCNVDRMFWLWQVRNGHTDNFEIIANYPGTNASGDIAKGGQGPAVGQQDDEQLTMETNLYPFLKGDAPDEIYYTSNDCINIETQLGFTYSDGSLSTIVDREKNEELSIFEDITIKSTKKLEVSNINRANFKGSFVIRAYAQVGEKTFFLGHRSILSRGDVSNCANCQTHLGVVVHFDLFDLTQEEIEKASFSVEIQHREHANNDKSKLQIFDTRVID